MNTAQLAARTLRRVRAFVAALLPRGGPRAGHRAERVVAEHLARRGWEILAANVRVGSDEVDLFALDEEGIPVVIEVKSSEADLRAPEEEVGPRKRAALRRVALALASDPRSLGRVPRIDVIAVRFWGGGAAIGPHLVDAVGDGPLRVPRRGELRRHCRQ